MLLPLGKVEGFKKYAELFHKSNTRNISKFGAIVENPSKNYQSEFLESMTDVVTHPDGTITIGLNAKPMTLDQKLNLIEKAAKDVISCINLIGNTHQRAIIDYCVWYRENHDEDTYEKAITKLASHCVVHSDFMTPNVQWQLVEFVEI